MEADQPLGITTIIHVRSYVPLNVSFPAPGRYRGTIKIMLPPSDPTFLTRVSDTESMPIALEFETKTPIDARTLFNWLANNTEELKKINANFAMPILKEFMRHLRVREYSKGSLTEPSQVDDGEDMLEPLHDITAGLDEDLGNDLAE